MAGKPLQAVWNSKAEHGERQLSAPAFYIPIDATLAGEMEAALLAAPEGRLPLLPQGEARDRARHGPHGGSGHRYAWRSARGHREVQIARL
jgi:hypothetical protein